MAGVSRSVQFDVDGVTLEADVERTAADAGVVLFVHGSGSSRRSPRNQFVAERLREAGLGTVLMDLLTPAEERAEEMSGHLRFDIPFLAGRVTGVMERLGVTASTPLGLFGASTGAAAALVAAAERPDQVRAVVSRGGRPDLAGPALPRVAAPTLLIVGGDDLQVADLNRQAMGRMSAEVQLKIISGASHLFPEPGALEAVAELAAAWFTRFLVQ